MDEPRVTGFRQIRIDLWIAVEHVIRLLFDAQNSSPEHSIQEFFC
jgi:hypothetical protein